MPFSTEKIVWEEDNCPLCGNKMTPMNVQFSSRPVGELTSVWSCHHCWSGCLWARTAMDKEVGE